MFRLAQIPVLIFVLILLSSCDKGYQVRFSNYYLEPIDSLTIGSNKVVFVNVEVKVTTEFKKIDKGDYDVRCKSKSGKLFKSTLEVPKKGTGDRTLQIDGLGSIITLEE